MGNHLQQLQNGEIISNINIGYSKERARGEIVEKRSSVLDQVRAQLLARSDVYFAGEIPGSGGGWTETVDIIVAPVKPIYDFVKLNKFMEGLISGIKTSAKDSATDYMDGGIHFGKLYFDEKLGVSESEVITRITAIEPEALQNAGVKIGESRSTHENRLERRTWVTPYPDIEVAKLVADYEIGIREGIFEYADALNYLHSWISPEQMRLLKANKNPFSKISGLLK